MHVCMHVHVRVHVVRVTKGGLKACVRVYVFACVFMCHTHAHAIRVD